MEMLLEHVKFDLKMLVNSSHFAIHHFQHGTNTFHFTYTLLHTIFFFFYIFSFFPIPDLYLKP